MAALDETAAAPQAVCPEGPEQTGDDFRQVLATYPSDDLRGMASELHWARGSLSKDLKRRIYRALRDFDTVIDIARDPQDVLAIRPPDDQSASERSDAAQVLGDKSRDEPNLLPPTNGKAG